MGGPLPAVAIDHLQQPRTRGARDHDDAVAGADGEMRRLAGLAGQLLQHRRGHGEVGVLLERARGQREELRADTVALGFAHLADVAQLRHGLDQVERGAVVQPDGLRQVRHVDPFDVAGDLLEDRERALKRLDATALLGRGIGRFVRDGLFLGGHF